MVRGPARAQPAAPRGAAESDRPHWEHLEHGASLGVRGIGPTRSAAFEQAALALTAVIVDPAAVEPSVTVAIRCNGDDDEQLLLAWLNAVIGEMRLRQMLFSRFQVEFRDGGLLGMASGERAGVDRHRAAVAVRRATRDNLKVESTPDGWLAQAVLELL